MTVNLSLFAGVGWQLFDNNGVILTGGKIYAYDAGTTTPRVTYTSSSGGTPHTNPIVLDAAGRVPSGEIWLTEDVKYKFILKTSADVTIATYDNVDGNGSGIETFKNNLANTSDAGEGDALVGFCQSNSAGLLSGSVGRTVHQKLQESVSVLDFGADPTGGLDSAAAIQDALNSGAKRIYAPSGTYKIQSTLTIPSNVSFYGDGPNETVFDGSTAAYANLTSGRHIQTAVGDFAALPNLLSNVAKGDTSVTFVNAPPLQVNDVFLIYNPTSYSYSGWRAEYRAGEYLRVASVNGSTVTLQGSLAADYAAASVSLYRYDSMTCCHLSDFRLIGLNDLSNPVFGLYLQSCVDSTVSAVKVTECSYTSISTSRCFNLSLINCTANENFANSSSGGEYGLAIGNSHVLRVVGGYYAAYRHGITTGGLSGIGYVTNRYVVVDGAHVAGADVVQTMDFHGNTEYSTITNCTIDGGVSASGNLNSYANNIIRCNTQNGQVAMYFGEMSGLDHIVANNIIENKLGSTSSARGAFIDVGGNNIAIGAETYSGGAFTVSGNLMVWGATSTDKSSPPIKLVNRGYAGTAPISVVIQSNVISVKNTTFVANSPAIEVNSSTAVPWDAITIAGNNFAVCGALRSVNATAANASARKVYVHNNVCFGSESPTIFANQVLDLISVKGNVFSGGLSYPIYVAGISTGTRCKRVHIANNTTYDNLIVPTSSAVNNADILVQNTAYAVVQSNAGGNFNERLNLASNTGFVVGETVTGNSSGATATVLALFSTTVLCIGTTGSAAFTPGETITGGTSGASSTLTNQTYTATYRNSYINIDNLWQGQNVGIRTSSDYTSGVTVNTPI